MFFLILRKRKKIDDKTILHKQNTKKSYETQNAFIMTTTAKQSSTSTDVRGSSPASSNFEPAEDIESIAKQISDHAEAIYQEWKARGLAPTEILKCHPDTDSSFSRSLSPKSSPTTPSATARSILDRHSQAISPELLAKAPELSTNNLKHLVDSFVNEDKARIAAQRSDSPVGSSSIKYALKKFENLSERSPSPVTSPPSYSSNAKSYSSPQQQDIINKTNSTLTNNNNLNYLNKNESQSQPHHVPDVLKDTIEKSSKRQKPETPVKPEHLLNHVPTWPLKHRLILQNNSDMKTPVDKKKAGAPSSSALRDKSPGIDVLDEVSREEEKLINALKTGTVLTNECLPEVSSINEYKSQVEQQLNGIDTSIKENNRNDNDVHAVTQQQQTPPPQKPNHTPIYVPHNEEKLKGFSSFTRVATTRIPSRHDSKSDDKKFELKSVPSPVRPFLSRGSVAERVLIFEKCPEKTPLRQTTEKPKIQVSLFIINCLRQ